MLHLSTSILAKPHNHTLYLSNLHWTWTSRLPRVLILSPSPLTSFTRNKMASRVGVWFGLITDNINGIRSEDGGGLPEQPRPCVRARHRWSNAPHLVAVWQLLGRARRDYRLRQQDASFQGVRHSCFKRQTRMYTGFICCGRRLSHLLRCQVKNYELSKQLDA